jgi:hypothetical protein
MKKIGEKIGRLTILKESGKAKDGHKLFLCRCDCGNETLVASNNFKSTKSCGCLRKEIQSRKAKKHGLSNERLYKEYYSMMTRCYNPNTLNFKSWGGKGIKVCEEWVSDKMNFIDWSLKNGYKDDLTLDRIDYQKDYSPSNCRWISLKEQSRNKSNNKFVLVNGKKRQLSSVCEELNLNYQSIYGKVIRRKGAVVVGEGTNKIIIVKE